MALMRYTNKIIIRLLLLLLVAFFFRSGSIYPSETLHVLNPNLNCSNRSDLRP